MRLRWTRNILEIIYINPEKTSNKSESNVRFNTVEILVEWSRCRANNVFTSVRNLNHWTKVIFKARRVSTTRSLLIGSHSNRSAHYTNLGGALFLQLHPTRGMNIIFNTVEEWKKPKSISQRESGFKGQHRLASKTLPGVDGVTMGTRL